MASEMTLGLDWTRGQTLGDQVIWDQGLLDSRSMVGDGRWNAMVKREEGQSASGYTMEC